MPHLGRLQLSVDAQQMVGRLALQERAHGLGEGRDAVLREQRRRRDERLQPTC